MSQAGEQIFIAGKEIHFPKRQLEQFTYNFEDSFQGLYAALIPLHGTITLKITGDTLKGTLKTGLEKKESWTRIQNIDSIEIIEAPLYALLSIGVTFASVSALISLVSSLNLTIFLLLLGLVLIFFSLINKRRYLVIYSHRYTIPVFMTKHSEAYQQFATNVLAIARNLNSSVSTQSQTQTP